MNIIKVTELATGETLLVNMETVKTVRKKMVPVISKEMVTSVNFISGDFIIIQETPCEVFDQV